MWFSIFLLKAFVKRVSHVSANGNEACFPPAVWVRVSQGDLSCLGLLGMTALLEKARIEIKLGDYGVAPATALTDAGVK